MRSILGYIGKIFFKEEIENALLKTIKRGPDAQKAAETEFIGYENIAKVCGYKNEEPDNIYRNIHDLKEYEEEFHRRR